MSTRDSQTTSQGADANLSRRTTRNIERDPGTNSMPKASTISFTAPNTISDSANGLALIKTNDVVDVRGSALNSRRYYVASGGSAGSFTVVPAVIQTEAAGATVTIIRES